MKKKNKEKIKKRKFKPIRLVVLFLFVYIIYYIFSYFINLPIKNIEITGNNLVSDYEIIMVAKIKDYPPILKVRTSKLKKSIMTIDLVKSVEIKKSFMGKLSIIIEEAKPLFLIKTENKIYLDNSKKINDNNITNIPILVNFVPNNIYDEFILAYAKLTKEIIANINYIEYQPNYNESGEVIDNKRFYLVMNDGNIVYTNPDKIINLNYYLDILSGLGNKKYILYLDSGNYDNFVFIPQ